MKILLVIPTIKQGGAERVITELANQWSFDNHEIHLILLAEADHFYKLDKRITVHQLGFKNLGKIQKIIAETKVFFKLRNLFKSERPDFVLSFMDKYNVLTILASRFLPIKIFISDRSSPNKKISTSLYLLKKGTYKFADGIIAQTALAKDIIYKNFYNKNIKTIPNPIKQVMLYPEIKREDIIINVGRMVPEKGQKYLIDAFSKLQNPDWKLVILGDGPLRIELESQIKKLSLENNIIIPGAVLNVDEWLARASIFAFSSISEGFPNALVEAMAAGLPSISFDCDAGPRDIITNSINGFLIETKNVNKLTEILNHLMYDTKLRFNIGIQAQMISDKLDIKLIANEYLGFFEQEQK